MARKVFYSFHYELDNFRVQQVINMGVVEGNQMLKPNDWEEVKRKGDDSVKRWIKDQMDNCDCLVVLIGSQTALRTWVDYEIRQPWQSGKGVLGVYIHGLQDRSERVSAKGLNPFSKISLDNGGRLSDLVTAYDPGSGDSKTIYGHIRKNLPTLVENAIARRK